MANEILRADTSLFPGFGKMVLSPEVLDGTEYLYFVVPERNYGLTGISRTCVPGFGPPSRSLSGTVLSELEYPLNRQRNHSAGDCRAQFPTPDFSYCPASLVLESVTVLFSPQQVLNGKSYLHVSESMNLCK